MAMEKVFGVCIVILLLCNVAVYLVTNNGVLVPTDLIIGNFISLGLIAILASVIPLTEGGTSIRWFVGTLTILMLLFRIEFEITLVMTTYPVSLGIGLATNVISLFSTSGLGFLPYLFFAFLSILATISGIISTSGAG
jgi:hypothetical protein